MSKYKSAIKLMNKRFKKDSLIAVATVEGGRPHVRMVDGYFSQEDNAFYAVTYTLSTKMRQIEANPEVAVCATNWFTGFGIGENLGWVREARNAEMMAKLRKAFAKWYTGGHVNEDDENTCLLRIKLTHGLLVDHANTFGFGSYEIDFTNKMCNLLSTSSPSSVIETEGRVGVVEVVKPQSWSVVHYELNGYKDKKINLKFSADVKRLGAAGEIKWEINNEHEGYPIICNIENAAPNTWHSFRGEWTGVPANEYPSLVVSTYENNSENTTYLISNFTIEIAEI
ncbi:MAG: pyridoxamine 5'-phosphate oxidase family protein [Defluviitaleaceae bacterium]|nr:pyridoxamine 5'-phosphate oxidase family protein [Defluviitaleaceae bacterium]MCL2263831.1 pyridoxamine 5'-phosphate oxidase family protein [Defluviitaleaceae bacterium]